VTSRLLIFISFIAVACSTTPSKRDVARVPGFTCDFLRNRAVLDNSMPCEQNKRWENYGDTLINRPQIYVEPRTENEVERIVFQSFRYGMKVRPVGSGHSWSRITQTDDLLMGTHQLFLRDASGRPTLYIDHNNNTVRVGAGQTIRSIVQTLEQSGYTLANLGDIQSQTIAGAISTNTHGSGVTHTGFAGAVKKFNIVDGRGILHQNVSWNNKREMYRSALSGLGMMGVITEVTLKIVPAFNIYSVQEHMSLHELIGQEKWKDLIEREWFSFLWVFGTEHAAVVTGQKAISSTLQPTRDNDFVDRLNRNLFTPFFMGLYSPNRNLLSRMIPPIYRDIRRSNPRKTEYQISSAALSKNIEPVHWPWNLETEFFIPVEFMPEFISEMAGFLNTVRDTNGNRYRPAAPILGFRFMKGDDTYLSPAYKYKGYDEFAAISVFDVKGRQSTHQGTSYLRAIRDILQRVVGTDPHLLRMHAGKVFLDNAPNFRRRIWNWCPFARARRRYDPNGTFLNSWTSQFFSRPCQ